MSLSTILDWVRTSCTVKLDFGDFTKEEAMTAAEKMEG